MHVRYVHVRVLLVHPRYIRGAFRSAEPQDVGDWSVLQRVRASSDRREGGMTAEESERVMTAEERKNCGGN